MANKKNPDKTAAEEKDLNQETGAMTSEDLQAMAEEKEPVKGAVNSEELAAMAEAQQREIERLKKELAAAQSQKTEVRKTDKQRVQEAVEKAIKEGKNLWDVKIAVRARPRTGTTEKHYWLGVNGRFLALPADDRYHEMALPYAECLVNAMNAENFVKEYADREIKVHDLITNPHEEEREM